LIKNSSNLCKTHLSRAASFLALLFLACGPLLAFEPPAEILAGETNNPDDPIVNEVGETPEGPAETKENSEEQEIEKAAEDALIKKMLLQREGPVFGVRWRGDVFFDVPLNGEPDNSSITLRRARLALYKGKGEKWNAKVSMELSAGDLQLQDAFIEFTSWKRTLAKVGVFHEPFSLESMSTARGQTFMEQALTVRALAPGRSVGAGLLKRTLGGILYGGVFLRSPPEEGQGEGGDAVTLRYVRSPIFRKKAVNLHFGASYSYRVKTKTESTRFRTRPEVGTTDDRYVNTDFIDGADKIQRFGLDFSRVNGRFSAQAEFMTLAVTRDGFENVRFWGAYAYVSWFLTGESRNYDQGSGRFRQVTPSSPLGKGGKGSFELAARISYLDLSNKDIIGGKQTNITVGLNWRPTANWRVMANLVKVIDVDRPGSEFDGLDPLIFSARLQWEF
jgi:phosphate-selective porin OprO/OprP